MIIMNSGYSELKPQLSGMSELTKFETIHAITTHLNQLHLIYDRDDVGLLKKLDTIEDNQSTDFKDYEEVVNTSCQKTGTGVYEETDIFVAFSRRYCRRFIQFKEDNIMYSPYSFSVLLSGILIGIRPLEIAGIERVNIRAIREKLQNIEREFSLIFRDVRRALPSRGGLQSFIVVNHNLAVLSWLYSFGRTLERPIEEAVQNRGDVTSFVRIVSSVFSLFFALAIPFLLLLIFRRRHRIEWLIDNLEDPSIVYALIKKIFGTSSYANGWLARDGPSIVDEWLTTISSEGDQHMNEIMAIRSMVNSNWDAVRFHRILTSSAMKSGWLEQRYEEIGDDILLRYLVVGPEIR